MDKDLKDVVIDALEEIKAVDIRVLDVTEMTSITDVMVICGGTSTRHVKSLADNLVKRAKEAGVRPTGVEGEDAAEWVLVDLGDVIVHIMLPETREFYKLERLWSIENRAGQSDGSGAAG